MHWLQAAPGIEDVQVWKQTVIPATAEMALCNKVWTQLLKHLK